jgi:hypothetical protein
LITIPTTDAIKQVITQGITNPHQFEVSLIDATATAENRVIANDIPEIIFLNIDEIPLLIYICTIQEI